MLVWPADPTHAAQGRDHPGGTLRLAVVSTPRTGNTWLRRMLDTVYSLAHVVVEGPARVDWAALPPRCILQTHWDPDPAFVARLEQHSFRPITLARHPLDVLLSILHLASLIPVRQQWYDGRDGGEEGLALATPCSRDFLDYASSSRARILLDISRKWAERPDCQLVRYEALVANPRERLADLCRSIHPVSGAAIDRAVEKHEFERVRAGVHNQHSWQGRPGHWRRFLPEAEARAAAAPHAAVFAAFGYECDADPSLTTPRAEATWYAVELASLKQECMIARQQVLDLQHANLEARVEGLEGRLGDLRTRLEEITRRRPWW
jgi:hypothetical protein